MSALLTPFLSTNDYLDSERASKTKHEYCAGQVYAMAGASARHNLIAMNTGASLHSQLRRQACTVYPSDLRVKVNPMELYTYPDLSVVCGAPRFEDGQRDTLLNPTVIVEVLSPSTENYDRGQKFQRYRALSSLAEYVLIAQDAMHVEHYARQPDGRWLLTEADGPEGVIHLAAIACDLALADVYEKVELDDDAAK
jgi:Uma2 family endonuclease